MVGTELLKGRLRIFALEAASPWVDAYCRLRNRFSAELLSSEVSPDSTREWLANPAHRVFVAIQEEELVGFGVIYDDRDHEVAIAVSQPKLGIGRSLLRHLEARARVSGHDLWAWTRGDNPAAQALFLRAGYLESAQESREVEGDQIRGQRFELKTRGGGTIGILQPSFLPWCGAFAQMAKSDVFVFYDDVDYDKNGWRNRNRILGPQGPMWLTVPVDLKGSASRKLHDILIGQGSPWPRKHLATLRQYYGREPNFDGVMHILERAYGLGFSHLNELNIHLVQAFCDHLGLCRPLFVRSSDLGLGGDRVERLIQHVETLGCKTFFEGAAGRNYLEPRAFSDRGLELRFQDYHHPEYPQGKGDFVSHLSVVDLLFRMGSGVLELIDSGELS